MKKSPNYRKNTGLILGIFALNLGLTVFLQAREFELQLHSLHVNDPRLGQFNDQKVINRIIVRVFENMKPEYGLLYANSAFKVSYPLLDNLLEGPVIKKEIYAWMIGRKFSWVRDSQWLDLAWVNDRLIQVDKLDLFNDQAVFMIVKAFRQLAQKKITGILIQDDLFLRFNEGLSPSGQKRFAELTGLKADEKEMLTPGTDHHLRWLEIKADRVAAVIAQIVSQCQEVNPAISVSMNIHYETPVFNQKSREWYSHDLGKILATGIDKIYLMSYHRQIKKELKLTEPQARHWFKTVIDRAAALCGKKLVVKIQVYDWDTGQLIPADELVEYLNLIPEQVENICFSTKNLGDLSYILDIINRINANGRK